MNTIATEILLESKTARNGQLTQVNNEVASDVLSKAKALVFALWQGTGAATTEQMADYYEVPVETVRTVFKRHRDELDSDGVKVLRGKALSEVRVIMNLTEFNRPHLTIWTPRAAFRLGMLLRDSEVAKQVRTVLLDVANGDRISEPNPNPQPLPTQAELTAMLAQETVKLEKKVNALVDITAEHDRAISELKEKVGTVIPEPVPLTAKEQITLEIEKVKLETEQFRLEVEKERNRGIQRPAKTKKRGPEISQPTKRPTLTIVPVLNVTKILELAERNGGIISARDVSKSFTADNRPTTQQVKEWFNELAKLKYGEVSVKGSSTRFILASNRPRPR
ncbi:hypothetical protein [Microcoleus sp. MON2_D5]|uniref:hypothetical protein n=1 Tax=Microcoleus sp. MON2_D5 TaxID=2818833 RepID=UPI002FCFD44E